jgi:hypothetical protein
MPNGDASNTLAALWGLPSADQLVPAFWDPVLDRIRSSTGISIAAPCSEQIFRPMACRHSATAPSSTKSVLGSRLKPHRHPVISVLPRPIQGRTIHHILRARIRAVIQKKLDNRAAIHLRGFRERCFQGDRRASIQARSARDQHSCGLRLAGRGRSPQRRLPVLRSRVDIDTVRQQVIQQMHLACGGGRYDPVRRHMLGAMRSNREQLPLFVGHRPHAAAQDQDRDQGPVGAGDSRPLHRRRNQDDESPKYCEEHDKSANEVESGMQRRKAHRLRSVEPRDSGPFIQQASRKNCGRRYECNSRVRHGGRAKLVCHTRVGTDCLAGMGRHARRERVCKTGRNRGKVSPGHRNPPPRLLMWRSVYERLALGQRALPGRTGIFSRRR